MKKFRLAKLQLTSDTANRSGLQTVNMTSSTPNTVTGTTFKNVLVDETGEFVVSSAPVWAITEVYRWNTAPATPSTGWLWVDTSNALNIQKQRDGTARVEVKPLQYDNTLFVDLGYGNNTTGLRERFDRPFATVAAAVTASLPWDTIVLRNGNYAMWALVLPHSLNFIAESWANWASWQINVPSWATVSYNWWTLNRVWSNWNLFLPLWDNITITWYVERWVADWLSIYNLQTVTAYNWLSLYFSIWTLLETSGTAVQYYLSKNAWATTLTNCDIYYKWHRMEWNEWFRWLLVDSQLQINCDIYNWINWWFNAWILLQQVTSTTRSRIIYNWDIYETNNWSAATQPVITVLGESYWYDMYINIKKLVWTTLLVQAASSINANIYCNGDYRSTTWYNIVNAQQSFLNPSAATLPLKLFFNVHTAENLQTVTKPTVAWYWTNGTVLWLIYWANAVVTSKVLRSLKNEVIWIDHSIQSAPDVFPTVLDIFWTRLEKLWRDVWAWCDWVIYNDHWNIAGTPPKATVRLYNWVSLLNLWDNVWFKQINSGATWPQFSLEYYDNVTTNNLINSNVLEEIYMYQPTNTISASWTYTVLDYENDLYYDLTLGSLTLVLPDPTKFINRELSIKVTWLHATNTITIDPVWAALIDGSATFTFGAITNLPNYTIKSNGTWRWIK